MSKERTISDVPAAYKVKEKEMVARGVARIELEADLAAHPGQYVMVWVPQIDEIPLSASGDKEITVKDLGPASHALVNKNDGEFVGVRGPFGHGFDLKDYHNILLVGGGVGVPPLKYLAQEYGKEKNLTAVIGGNSAEDIFFTDHFSHVKICTDDGSQGFKGYPTKVAEWRLNEEDFDLVCACGPEPMLEKLFELAEERDIEVQFSMERRIKCGMGICGHCAVDEIGWRVCKDGPVIGSNLLRKADEFFNYKRDKAGFKQEI